MNTYVKYNPIGFIHSPFKTIENMPIQPGGAVGIPGSVELFAEYQPALQDLDGFSYIYLLYHFHRVNGVSLTPTPFLDSKPHGLFATRAPKRPNPIGLSIVKLISVEESILHIENVDILDGTPLLDIKPYIPAFDHVEAAHIGWLERYVFDIKTYRSDQRFK